MIECVKCGYCCRQSACPFGEWDTELNQCKFLTKESLCRRYDEIKDKPLAQLSPAFGGGCSSPMFNKDREDKLND